jgi:hypothetical protein
MTGDELTPLDQAWRAAKDSLAGQVCLLLCDDPMRRLKAERAQPRLLGRKQGEERPGIRVWSSSSGTAAGAGDRA